MLTDLNETIDLMVSADYKDRFKAEYEQLRIRKGKLENMVAAWDFGTLSFTPTCPRCTYTLQINAMKDYLYILEMRAKIEGIELD